MFPILAIINALCAVYICIFTVEQFRVKEHSIGFGALMVSVLLISNAAILYF